MHRELTVQDAGIVHQNVQVPELLQALVKHGLDLGRVTDVGLYRQNAAGSAGLCHLIPQLLQPAHAAGRGDDHRALLSKQLRRGSANAGAGACYDGNLSFKTHFVYSLLLLSIV